MFVIKKKKVRLHLLLKWNGVVYNLCWQVVGTLC